MENLFKKFIRHKRKQSEERFDRCEEDQKIYLDKDEIIEEGIFKFRNLRRSGFCTFYCGLSFWNIKSDYFKESRKASQRIKDFTRVYIIRDASDLDNSYLVSQILEDIKSDTRAYLCLHDDIPNLESKKDFGIWDDEYVCVVQYSSDNLVTGITVSGKKNDLEKAKGWRDAIVQVSQTVTSRADIDAVKKNVSEKSAFMSKDRYKEFQHTSIELQMAVAAKECTASAIDPGSCAWYHSSWPILRALNVVSTPNWHDDFYTASIARYQKKHDLPLHILISASADATILEHIEAAIGDMSRAVIWIVDLCPTPLEIARSYAKVRSFPIHAVQMDVMHLREQGLPQNFFDIVITDAFLTRFQNKQEKETVVKEWRGALKKGGQVITTCRVTGTAKETGNKNDQDVFVKKTLHEFELYSKRSPAILKYIHKDLARLSAEQYAEHITSYPISAEDLRDIFCKNNFVMTDGNSETMKTVSGEFKSTTYTHIAAAKL
ncbi:MAG: methyltransferase domain-containing protein [Candidatus Uhrbacteria bacterium]|nr:methyltransferase domain-containing protein [Candidatus Uhrbacteria bacterium]